MNLNNKKIIVGVSASISVYKAADLVSSLKKMGADVHVIMTKSATELISPLVFESLSGNKCHVDIFEKSSSIEHIAITKKTDLFIVAPATANTIADMAHGHCDSMLTATFAALDKNCPVVIAPAMNTNMYLHKPVQENIDKLRSFGHMVIDPVEGLLACGDLGIGKLAPIDRIIDSVIFAMTPKDLIGISFLVSAGATVEPLDPVRFISNHSTGKMGYAIALSAVRRGADVTLVLGENRLASMREDLMNIIHVKTAKEMHEKMIVNLSETDFIIMSAAVADYRPSIVSEQKIKKKSTSGMTIELEQNPDILADLGNRIKDTDQILCGFAMETEDLLVNGLLKLKKKGAHMIVANYLNEPGAGFGTNTNKVAIITENNVEYTDLLSKEKIANQILDSLYCFSTEAA